MGVMGRVFTGIRAPSTLGTFLRTFTFGHVRVLDAVAADFLVNLIGAAPALRDAAVVTYLDIDDTVKATHGYTRQGAGYGYSGIKGLNALIATVSTPISAPLIAATRLRKGSANSARGAARLIGDALATTKRCGATGLVILRADSAYYNHDVVAAAARGGAKVSITARMNPAVVRAISTITDSAWTPIQYPNPLRRDSGHHRTPRAAPSFVTDWGSPCGDRDQGTEPAWFSSRWSFLLRSAKQQWVR